MKYLLDTHTLLWALFSPKELSKSAREALLDSKNEICVSSISFWEISLKYNLGKLKLKGLSPEALPQWTEKSGFSVLELGAKEAATFHELPRTEHKDPFDRMLVWQSIQNKMPLVTKDASLKAYQKLGLRTLW